MTESNSTGLCCHPLVTADGSSYMPASSDAWHGLDCVCMCVCGWVGGWVRTHTHLTRNSHTHTHRYAHYSHTYTHIHTSVGTRVCDTPQLVSPARILARRCTASGDLPEIDSSRSIPSNTMSARPPSATITTTRFACLHSSADEWRCAWPCVCVCAHAHVC